MVTVGAITCPDPPEVNIKPVTLVVPSASPVIAVAAVFSPPENITVGTEV